METLVLDGQSLFDIALQECGSVEAVFALAVRNGISITDDLETMQKLEIPSILNKRITDYYYLKNITPATGITNMGDDTPQGSGIEFWAIEVDFIVS